MFKVPDIGAEVTVQSELPQIIKDSRTAEVGKVNKDMTDEVPQVIVDTPFEIISNISTFASKRFRLNIQCVQFKIKAVPKNIEPLIWIKSAVDGIINMCLSKTSVGDKIGFTLSGESFLKGDAWVSFKNADQVKHEDIWSALGRIFQSNTEGLSTDIFTLKSTIIKMPMGTGRVRRYSNFEQECVARRGIIEIKNKDNLCLPRAIVVAVAYISKSSNYKEIRDNRNKQQTVAAQKLVAESGVVVPENGCGIEHLKKFQNFLRDRYKITVYDYATRSVLFEGHSENILPKQINLLYHNSHYNVITSLTSTFCCTFFCETCHVGYQTRNRHRCSGTCPCCQKSPPCSKVASEISCAECNRKFRGEQCFNNHKVDGALSSNHGICSNIKKCSECFKTYKVKKNKLHQCGEQFCKNCHKFIVGDHLCYIKPDKKHPPSTKDSLFVFYDLETRQESNIFKHKLHEANLCVYKQCCDKCITCSNNNNDCEKCGRRLNVLLGNNCVDKFVSNLIRLSKQFKKVVILAHNGKAFDHQFILKYFLEETNLTPKLIMRGTQIILMEIQNIKFIDSLNFFPMPLSALPKAFGLKNVLKRDIFHIFLTLSKT